MPAVVARGGAVLTFTVRLEETGPARTIKVEGYLDVRNATEFSHLSRRLSDALGEAQVDLTEVDVADPAGQSAVRHLARHLEEFGGTVLFPRGWVEASRSPEETAWRESPS